MMCLQLANQIGLFFLSTTHCELTFKMAAEEQLVPMPQSGCFIIQLPRRVLRVYGLGYLPGSVFQGQAPSCVPALIPLRRKWFQFYVSAGIIGLFQEIKKIKSPYGGLMVY